jgi:membrane-bound metal-dependent hydrolase YbcI (DUF457 family)
MDPFFHFLISFSGGYVILAELYKKPKMKEALVLSFLAGFIDLDHLFPSALLFGSVSNGQVSLAIHVLHNIFTVLILLLVSAFLFKKTMKIYGYTISVMIFGHLLFDMTREWGVFLFFPISKTLYVIPDEWRIKFIGNSYLLDIYGIALLTYFAAVFLAVVLLKKKYK